MYKNAQIAGCQNGYAFVYRKIKVFREPIQKRIRIFLRVNFPALNLADEISSGKRSVKDAHKFYAETIKEMKHQEYTKGFLFQVSNAEEGKPRQRSNDGPQENEAGEGMKKDIWRKKQ